MKPSKQDSQFCKLMDSLCEWIDAGKCGGSFGTRCQQFTSVPRMRLANWGRLRVAQLYDDEVGIQQHRMDLLESGESQVKVDGTEEWRECRLFSRKERLALALAEALTLCPESSMCRIIFWYAHYTLGESEFIELVVAIQSVNEWNFRYFVNSEE